MFAALGLNVIITSQTANCNSFIVQKCRQIYTCGLFVLAKRAVAYYNSL